MKRQYHGRHCLYGRLSLYVMIYIVTTMTIIFNHKDTMMIIVNIIIIIIINNNNSNIETTSVFHCKSSSKAFGASRLRSEGEGDLIRQHRLDLAVGSAPKIGENDPVEIVDLPIENGWVFHSYGTVYQMVS